MSNLNINKITEWFVSFTIMVFMVVSLYHLIDLWGLTNNRIVSILLSIATALAVLGSMAATNYSNWAIAIFVIVISFEFMGNIFASYLAIKVSSQQFVDWKTLMQPIFLVFYSESYITDETYKRYLAIINGGYIPVITAIFFKLWMTIKLKNKDASINTQTDTKDLEDDSVKDDTVKDDVLNENILPDETTNQLEQNDGNTQVEDDALDDSKNTALNEDGSKEVANLLDKLYKLKNK